MTQATPFPRRARDFGSHALGGCAACMRLDECDRPPSQTTQTSTSKRRGARNSSCFAGVPKDKWRPPASKYKPTCATPASCKSSKGRPAPTRASTSSRGAEPQAVSMKYTGINCWTGSSKCAKLEKLPKVVPSAQRMVRARKATAAKHSINSLSEKRMSKQLASGVASARRFRALSRAAQSTATAHAGRQAFSKSPCFKVRKLR
mmetsp:Transcript_5264/g.19813  ORF Transcript_5264/g.19813 Transcript_5264/m.19813 type:complete len:204 (+) Transcript_5264:540-1151(+)